VIPIVACLGGWCQQREKCAHYWSPSRTMVERLCEKSNDEPTPVDKSLKEKEKVE
jgi:hypothetical protein